jgi:hypothetical protein
MADLKISELTNLTAADPVSDMLPIVDVSATPPASGSTKRISINNLLSSSPTASGALTVTGLVTAGSATITGAATVGTTLGVTGVSTLASVGVTGAATVGTTLLVGTNATLTNGNVIIGTSGKGIDFSAVTGGTGTATANVLNDYEEGTFVPTIVGNTIAGVGVYGDQNGRYTKVGRLVTCQIFVNWTAHTGTGDMFIGGLPFATASISGIYHAATIGWANNIALTAGHILTGYAGHNASTIISLQQYPTGGGAMIAVPIDTLGGFIVSLSYIA